MEGKKEVGKLTTCKSWQ